MLGYIVRGPLGGLVWHHLQYVVGLHRLGHDVYFIEDSDDYDSCYDPLDGTLSKNPAFGLRFIAATLGSFGLGARWTYFDAHTSTWLGPCASNAVELFRTADLLLNLSAVNPIREWTLGPPHRALIDTDPVFTQVRHLTNPASLRAAETHTTFFTFAENIGKPGCLVPADGLPWRRTRQPVTMDDWPVTTGPVDGRFTTVMQWDSYSVAEYGGHEYGMKSMSFEDYMALPACAPAELELAVGSPTAPRDLLRSHGWVVSDPLEATRDAWTYQRFIQRSKGEFSVAKQAYVISRSGWFSERSAAYLASGRPVVTQDTGFSEWLDGDAGVLPFDSPGAALEAIARVNADYVMHCRRARALAEDFFAAALVLPDLVRRATQREAMFRADE